MYYCKDIKLLLYSLQGCGIIMMRDIYTVTPTLFSLTRNALTPISCLAPYIYSWGLARRASILLVNCKIMFVLLVLLLCGRGLAQSQSGFNLQTAVCYADINCAGSIIPLQPTVTAKDCCVGANDGRSYSHDGNCIVKVCIG